MSVEFNYLQSVTLQDQDLSDLLELIVDEEGFMLGELAIQFVSDEYLYEMNKEVLDHDYYTDIITIDFNVGELVSGDLFISIERVEENATELGVSFDEELSRVIIHGVLHLCGYEDGTDEEKEEMRERENYYLTKLTVG